MTTLPDWMRPPRPEGWLADDLDNLPQAPRHTELIDGTLVFMMSPQKRWHRRVIHSLDSRLAAQAPDGFFVDSEMTVRLDDHNQPEPDVIVTTRTIDRDETWYPASDVVLAVEVVSPESAHRDRTVKMTKYAQAGIAHFWRIEDDGGTTAIHVYELDDATRTYVPVTIARGTLELDRPFPILLDVPSLYPAD